MDKKMSKNENPKKLSQQIFKHLFTQCSETFIGFLQKHCQKYYIHVVQQI
jgi:hypothetical protein